MTVIEPSTGREVNLDGLSWEEKFYTTLLAARDHGWDYDGKLHDTCLLAMAADELDVMEEDEWGRDYEVYDVARVLSDDSSEITKIYTKLFDIYIAAGAFPKGRLKGALGMVRRKLKLDKDGKLIRRKR